jgi:hypothetical protein
MYIGGPSGWYQQETGERKERILRGEKDGSTLYIYIHI